MDKTGYLRRQAEFCLRLSHLCSDEPVSRHLNALAARYHEEALLAEFHTLQDDDDNAPAPVANWH
jgi:hypothetical protein